MPQRLSNRFPCRSSCSCGTSLILCNSHQVNYVYLILSFRTHMVNFMCIHQSLFPYIVLNFTFCLYYKLLYSISFYCIITLVAAVALQIMRGISTFQGASARWPRPSSLGPKGPIHLNVQFGWHLSELDRCFFVRKTPLLTRVKYV